MMNRNFHLGGLVVALCLGLVSLGAVASEPIGFVKTVSGPSARIAAVAGAERGAEVGSPLFVGDTLRTGKGSALGLTLRDDTLMSIGPDTELTLEDYLFEPARDELKLGSRLGRGTLQFVSGSIARLKPEAVTVTTPTGTIGVRGTHFAVKVAP